jgi:hypothetical protein
MSGDRAQGFCFVAPFDPLDLFPSFVRLKAYRPLAIQQVLINVSHFKNHHSG